MYCSNWPWRTDKQIGRSDTWYLSKFLYPWFLTTLEQLQKKKKNCKIARILKKKKNMNIQMLKPKNPMKTKTKQKIITNLEIYFFLQFLFLARKFKCNIFECFSTSVPVMFWCNQSTLECLTIKFQSTFNVFLLKFAENFSGIFWDFYQKKIKLLSNVTFQIFVQKFNLRNEF